jgi:hypothetical protein
MLTGLAALGVAMCVTATASERGENVDVWAPQTQSLAGEWDILPGHESEDLFKPEAAAKAGAWGRVPVPGLWPQATGLPASFDGRRWPEVSCVWYRRRFDVPREAQYRRAVLRLAAVRWGSKVWVNGREVGGHLGAFRVTDLDVTEALKPGAPNEIVMRLIGWPAIPRSKSDQRYLIAAGSAPHSWGLKVGGVAEFISLHYHDEVYIRSARIVGDPETGWVGAHVRYRNYGQHYGRLSAHLDIVRGGRVVATADRDVPLAVVLLAKRADQWLDLAATVRDAVPWSPEDPQLYEARVTLTFDGQVADVYSSRFGFRRIEIKDRAFYLNGKRLFLTGTNLVGEDLGARRLEPAQVVRYLRDVPRLANVNCFRSHSIPFTQRWCDIADEAGVMFLQEFPLTVNYETFDFTPEEFAAFKAHVEDEYLTMIELYWNHPSIIMWVPTNESPRWEEWENGALYRMFREADPSRPVMRAGRVSPDIYDTHCYDGWWSGAEGDFDQQMTEAAEDARRSGKPFTNTEYVENCHKQRAYRLLGSHLDALAPDELNRTLDHLRGEIVSYQSECLRRLGAQLIIHYMGICVRDWQDPQRMAPNASFYAMKNAFAPVGVSIDLFNRHFEAGKPLTTAVHVMNGTGSTATGTLEAVVLSSEPTFSWDGAAPASGSFAATLDGGEGTISLKPFETRIVKVTWPLPKNEGKWVLAAVWRSKGRDAVHSRRVVFTVVRPAERALAQRKIAVYDADGALTKWLTGQGARPVAPAEAEVALVGPQIHRMSAFAAAQTDLRAFVERGGTLVVLEQGRWVFDDLARVETPIVGYRSGIPAAFPKDQPGHPMWRGVPVALLRRWNGLPGVVARYGLTTDLKHDVLAVGTDRTEFPTTEVAADLSVGKGRIVFCQFKIVERLDRATPNFDPVAERLLLNLLRP